MMSHREDRGLDGRKGEKWRNKRRDEGRMGATTLLKGTLIASRSMGVQNFVQGKSKLL